MAEGEGAEAGGSDLIDPGGLVALAELDGAGDAEGGGGEGARVCMRPDERRDPKDHRGPEGVAGVRRDEVGEGGGVAARGEAEGDGDEEQRGGEEAWAGNRVATSHAIILAEDLTMSISSPTDAEAFYQFLGATLSQGERETPPERLLRKWREERELAESCEAIREGIAEMNAGKGRPAAEVFTELKQKHGFVDR